MGFEVRNIASRGISLKTEKREKTYFIEKTVKVQIASKDYI